MGGAPCAAHEELHYPDPVMGTSADLRVSPEEYLRIERADEWRNEYLDGEILPREHPSPRHIIIATNLSC